MTSNGISRRRLMHGAVGLVAAGAAYRALGRSAFAADPASLDAVTRTIEVKGKAAKVYGLLNASGARGLGFTAGDSFYVRLNNRLLEPTLIHWHGLTPPSRQDGVPVLAQDPLAAGASFVYDFRLTQPGTYWMHSHFSLTQTQRLMSAPLIIRAPEDLKRDEQEVVVLLNDFTFRDPEEILAQLQGRAGAAAGKEAGGGMNMGASSGAPSSHMGAMGSPGSMGNMGNMRTMGNMGAMKMGSGASPEKSSGMAMSGQPDVNDIEFDAYLANDRTLADPEVVQVERGGQVRLRFINGADSTNFHVDLGALEGALIAVDGEPIVPVRGRTFPLAMAQRLDIRLRLPSGGGAFPVLAVREGDAVRTGIVLASKGANVERVAEQGKTPGAILGLELEAKLRAAEPLPPRRADRTHQVVLGGDMEKYLWTINGAVYGKDKPLPVSLGERVELAMNDTTGMSHPMHLHGTPFQVVAINGRRFNGARRDTVLVPPRTTVTVAFDANNAGRWAFHCHNAYHQEAGMMSSVDYV